LLSFTGLSWTSLSPDCRSALSLSPWACWRRGLLPVSLTFPTGREFLLALFLLLLTCSTFDEWRLTTFGATQTVCERGRRLPRHVDLHGRRLHFPLLAHLPHMGQSSTPTLSRTGSTLARPRRCKSVSSNGQAWFRTKVWRRRRQFGDEGERTSGRRCRFVREQWLNRAGSCFGDREGVRRGPLGSVDRCMAHFSHYSYVVRVQKRVFTFFEQTT
jgi:hypothetical protein